GQQPPGSGAPDRPGAANSARAFIHNEERKLPDEWEVRMSEFRVKSQIAKEVLSLLGIMLFNANEKVQESMLKYFLHTKEEVFFYAVRNRMQMSTANIKEKRLLISQQRARLQDAKSQADNLRTTMTLGVKALQVKCGFKIS
uniref:GED domain-containing protein n=1 Tax=Macrostomum lignano TaxID=282301 RepID=A0A1I8IZA7_9PLAT